MARHLCFNVRDAAKFDDRLPARFLDVKAPASSSPAAVSPRFQAHRPVLAERGRLRRDFRKNWQFAWHYASHLEVMGFDRRRHDLNHLVPSPVPRPLSCGPTGEVRR